jgi:hypothetical protein
VVGVDGADWAVIEELWRQERLPVLRGLARDGSRAVLKTSWASSPVIWSTVATGVLPSVHGISGFVDATDRGDVPVSSTMRRVPAMALVRERRARARSERRAGDRDAGEDLPRLRSSRSGDRGDREHRARAPPAARGARAGPRSHHLVERRPALILAEPPPRQARRGADLLVQVQTDAAALPMLLDRQPMADVVTAVHRISGGHGATTDGVLIAAGPDIASGAKLDGIHVRDMTPTFLYGLGAPVARDFAGRPWPELYTSESVSAIRCARSRAGGRVSTGARRRRRRTRRCWRSYARWDISTEGSLHVKMTNRPADRCDDL